MHAFRPAASQDKTLVVGLGKTGLSCLRYLKSKGVVAAVTDSRERPPGLDALQAEMPEVAAFIGGFEPDVFASASELVVSPGVPIAEPLIQQAIARGVPVIGDIELFAREAQAPLCAITGSNGKSTVTSLVGLMARLAGRSVAVGGNLGEPVLDLIEDAVDLYVVELSSFQLETAPGLQPAVAAVLNVSADHLDRYPDLAAYAATKARIYGGAQVAVVNRDDPLVSAMPRAAEREVGFTLGAPEPGDFGLRRLEDRLWVCRGVEPLMQADEVLIPGRHNLANALAGLALASAAGLPMEAACEALRRFPGLPHRSQLIADHAGVRWYDDSKGTNPGATIAALEGLVPEGSAGRVVLIAGGDGKGADFAPLRSAVVRAARALVLIGRDAPLIEEAVAGAAPVARATDMADAVSQAAALAEAGDAVLLSPACASFDMFDSYEHRGQVFADAVRRLSL
ncbi:UDP-N-acetylmuramoyl-L-alanine--D-glutamate ligase [Thiorhodococcus minor]|uniref:UDP-N-acetylmuramoylalanine--D-glutamate ligase n=1 Tax=Thiorhodococcus minor TaxID=57489 RepID=A0A6M0JWS5_9GAMM|nr:UDP-N-acetylmuramoyl-L-alanine--D-glutamate ligase [Thiorhodococcus minor]NEV61986.1 UDP-N-acetylmuramoyl-L-alanine--D-glutamate ligase [Thiorhodococcus minor]